jgi:hypothetical protein
MPFLASCGCRWKHATSDKADSGPGATGGIFWSKRLKSIRLAVAAGRLAALDQLKPGHRGAAHGGGITAGRAAGQLATRAGVVVWLARVGDTAVVALDGCAGVAGRAAHRVAAAVCLGVLAGGLAARSLARWACVVKLAARFCRQSQRIGMSLPHSEAAVQPTASGTAVLTWGRGRRGRRRRRRGRRRRRRRDGVCGQGQVPGHKFMFQVYNNDIVHADKAPCMDYPE